MAKSERKKGGRLRANGDGGLFYVPSRKLYRGVVELDAGPDGRRRQKTVMSKTRAGAKAKLEKIQAEIRDHGAPLSTSTVADWSEHWLTTVCRPRYKPNALAATESIVRTWIIPALGKKKVAAVKPSDVRAVLQAVTKAGRSTATKRKVYDVLSLMLESARLDGLAGRNVGKDVIKPAVEAKQRGALSTDQALSVLSTAADHVDGTRWWVTLLAGLRQGERLGATLDSLDLDAGMLTVQWELDEVASEHGCGESTKDAKGKLVWPCGRKRGASCPESRYKLPDGITHRHLYGRLFLLPPKSGRSRAVPLIPSVAEAMRRYLAATAHLPNPHGLIWRHDDGRPYLPNEDQEAWRDILFRAGVITEEQAKPPKDRAPGTTDTPTTHWGRHTTATILMLLGVDAKIIGEIVGHVDEKTTRGYQHVSSPMAREAMERIGAHFASALEAPRDPV